MRLHSKILLLVMPLIIVPIASIGWLAYERLSRISEQAMLHQADTLVSQTEQQVKTFYRTLQSNLELFAASPMLTNYLLTSEDDRFELLQRPLLRQFKLYHQAFPEYYEIRVLLEDGYEDARYAAQQLDNLSDEESKNPTFQAMHGFKGDIFFKLFTNPDTRTLALWAAKRVMLADTSFASMDAQEPSLRGYLVLTVELNFFQQQVSNQIGKQGTLFFTNRAGKILFHQDSTKIDTFLPEKVTIQLGLDEHFKLTSGAYLYLGKRLQDDLVLVTQLAEAEIYAAGNQLGGLISLITISAILITVALLLLLLNRLLTDPIQQLKDAARRIGEGQLDQPLEMNRTDEISALADNFNSMAQELEKSRQRADKAQAEATDSHALAISNLQQADKRKGEFLANTSQEFLQLLGKESILDVKIGDHVVREMTVLFADIRCLTPRSEGMTQQGTYDYTNQYLGSMEPVIYRHKGFIDKYMGNGIMALFPTHAEDAVNGAIEMLQELKRFNARQMQSGMAATRICIGLSTGPFMLGMVGGSHRMEGIVISDSVTLASRIEDLAKLYGIPLLISEHTLAQLAPEHGHLIREVNSVKVMGQKVSARVYEVFDADPEDLIEQKQTTLTLFNQGVQYFSNGEWKSAKKLFLKVVEISPDDISASIYVKRCKQEREKHRKHI